MFNKIAIIIHMKEILTHITIDNLKLVLFAVFIAAASIQVLYYLFFYIRIISNKKTETSTNFPPVSIVICARNEAKNLRKNLTSILEQDYPNFEVIIVNDCSSDDTEIVLKQFLLKYKNLKTTFLREDEKFSHGKKLALTVGIKAAKNEWLVLTDADCMAASDQWLRKMANHMTEDKNVVLGYGGYNYYNNNILNQLIRFDTMFIGLQYLTFALAGVPYMGVGRNLAYRKSVFFSNKGFASHVHLESGDDDLFINKAASRNKVAVEYSIPSHTLSKPKSQFLSWVHQKRRHITTGSEYKFIHQLLLAGELISRSLFNVLFIILISIQFKSNIVLYAFLARTILFYLTITFTTKKLNERRLLLFSIFYDLILPFIYLWLEILNKMRPVKRWR